MNEDLLVESGEDKDEILIFGISSSPKPSETMRGGVVTSKLTEATKVEIGQLQTQINVFLNQLDQVLSDTPEKVGSFSLSEFEITAGIVVQGKGKIGLAVLGAVELSGQASAGIKFVFKRS